MKSIKKKTIKKFYLRNLENDVLKYVNARFTVSTQLIYKGLFKRFIEFNGNVEVHEVTMITIEDYIYSRISSVNRTSINIEIRTLKAIFNLAVRWNIISVNPAKEIRQFQVDEKERLSFSDTQLKQVMAKIKFGYFRNIIIFALNTGCRISEILNIQWKDIDFRNKIIKIRNKDGFRTKSGRNRVIYLNEYLMDILVRIKFTIYCDWNTMDVYLEINDYCQQNDYLFTNQGKKILKNHISKSFKKVLRNLNFDEAYCFHCLRHTFASKLMNAGVNINYISKLLGHSSIMTTMNYLHLDKENFSDAVNKINYG